jgi:acyl carrier protein
MFAEKGSHFVIRKSEVVTKSTETLTLETLKNMIAMMLQIEAKGMNENEKLTTYGVDSLLAVEISSLLAKYGIQVSQMDILGGATISSILK